MSSATLRGTSSEDQRKLFLELQREIWPKRCRRSIGAQQSLDRWSITVEVTGRECHEED